MPDYRKMTVESLRDLARKVLGPGHAKRTKPELVSLLEGAGSARAKGAPRKVAAKPAVKAVGRAAKPAAKGGKAAKATPRAKPAAKAAAPKAKAARKAAPRKAAAGQREVQDDSAQGAEGYFVARVRGEEAVRDAPHPLTEAASDAPPRAEEPARSDEGLGELPWGYGDDTFMALPRDPRTLFLFWDFSAETTGRAFAGVEGGRAELRVFARAGTGWEEVRRIDFALESRGFYVHDLEPGRVYRAEIHAIGRGGEDRSVGAPTNDMMLPPLGPSPVIDDRFIRIPWEMPLGRLLGPGHAGGPFSDEARALLARLSDWSRFGSGGGSAGGIGGRGPGGGGLGSGSGSGAGPLGGGSGAGRGP